MVRDTSAVKRSDLTLRCRYVGLETEIYQMDEHRFAIYCKNYRGSFEKLRAEFDHSIRRMGTWVELTQEIPGTYFAKIEPIPLSNAVDGFKGAYITRPDVENAIIDRFPDVDICGIHIVEGMGYAITVEVAPETPQETMTEMEAVSSFSLKTRPTAGSCAGRTCPKFTRRRPPAAWIAQCPTKLTSGTPCCCTAQFI